MGTAAVMKSVSYLVALAQMIYWALRFADGADEYDEDCQLQAEGLRKIHSCLLGQLIFTEQ